VPTAITANGVIGGEDLQEVRVQLVRADRAEPAQARQGVAFLMDQAVVPPMVVGFEDQKEMIRDLLIIKLRETARASHGGGTLLSVEVEWDLISDS
jgi:hypothetical protein